MWVTTAKITINVSGAQAHFSTTQQIFSSSSDPKKQICISNLLFFFFSETDFPWEVHKVAPAKMEKFLLQCNRGSL